MLVVNTVMAYSTTDSCLDWYSVNTFEAKLDEFWDNIVNKCFYVC